MDPGAWARPAPAAAAVNDAILYCTLALLGVACVSSALFMWGTMRNNLKADRD